MAQSGQLVDETSVDQEADDRQEERLPQAGHPATDHHILDQRQENTSERKNRGDHRHAHRDVSERELPAELGGAADTVQGRWEDWTRTRGAPTRHRRASFWGGTLIPEELMTAPVPSVTRLSARALTRGFASPPRDGFAFIGKWSVSGMFARPVRSNGHAASGSLWMLIEEVLVSVAVLRPIRELSCDSTDRQPADGKDRHRPSRHDGEHVSGRASPHGRR